MDSTIDTTTKMERAFISEAIRQLSCWWPENESTFWLTRVAVFAALGSRADLPAVSPEGRAMLQSVLDDFNETACLSLATVIPPGWKLVPCVPTEEMIRAGMASRPFPRLAHARTMIERIKLWVEKRRRHMRAAHGGGSDDELQWMKDQRSDVVVNYCAMVDVAPPPPWQRR